MKEKAIAWLKRESGKKYIIPLVGVFAFLESIIIPIPVDIFTLTLSAVQPKKWFRIATVATVCSVLGGIAAYFLGAYFFDTVGIQIIQFFGVEDVYQNVLTLFNRGVFIVMFTSAFTPIPYKIFTLAGGALNVAIIPFIIASLIGRGLRFYLEAFIPYKFGEVIGKRFYKIFNWSTFVLVVLVVAFMIIKKYLL